MILIEVIIWYNNNDTHEYYHWSMAYVYIYIYRYVLKKVSYMVKEVKYYP